MTWLFDVGLWRQTQDGDIRAFRLFQRHYSYYEYADNRRDDPTYRNRFQFVGPGEHIVLISPDCDALFVWRKFISADGQQGINCSVFRNEGPVRSSRLILDAERFAIRRWGPQRFFTYVNAREVRSSNPGFCFLKAGWRKCGITKKRKYLILEKIPNGETAEMHPRTERAVPSAG